MVRTGADVTLVEWYRLLQFVGACVAIIKWHAGFERGGNCNNLHIQASALIKSTSTRAISTLMRGGIGWNGDRTTKICVKQLTGSHDSEFDVQPVSPDVSKFFV